MQNKKMELDIKKLYEDFAIANKINNDNFFKIIKDNKDTKYGKANDFEHINSIEDYVSKIPLTDYSNYRDRIDNAFDYTAYPVYDMLITSGSTGKQKIFPITTEALKRYSSIIVDYPNYINKVSTKAIHVSVFRKSNKENNLLSALYYGWLKDKELVDFDNYVGGKELLFSNVGGIKLFSNNNIDNVPYLKTWLMFSYPELSSIQSIYLYDILMLCKWIEQNWKTVLNDIKNKKVSIDLSDDVKAILLNTLPNEEFINRIENELNKGFDEPFLPRLYKKIKYISGIGGNLYSVQEKQLKKYIGEIPKYEFAYALSECIVGVALEMDKAEYALLPNNAYYEFCSKETEQIISLKELQIGETYELILTTFSGLYRYRTGDLLKITRFEGETPIFEIVGKKEQVINIAGEKVDSAIAIEAVNSVATKYQLNVHDFAFGINTKITPFGYHIFIENDKIIRDNTIKDDLDEILCKLSADYKDLRMLGLLSRPEVHFIDCGLIQKSLNEEKKLRHNKPQIFLNEYRTNYLLKEKNEFIKK